MPSGFYIANFYVTENHTLKKTQNLDFTPKYTAERAIDLIAYEKINDRGKLIFLFNNCGEYKKYKIQSYKIGYLRTPNKISLENPVVEYTDFNDNVMYEIIKIAAQMYIENRQDKRYETITNEVNTQE